MKSEVLGLGAVLVRARDPQKVSRWYAAVLGFEMDLAQAGGFYGVLATPDGEIHLAVTPRPTNMPAGPPTVALTWRVSDYDEHVARARAAGATVREEIDDDQGRFAYLRDPEGNEVALWGSPAGARASRS